MWRRQAAWLATAAWLAAGTLVGSGSVWAQGARPTATAAPRAGPPPVGRYGGELCVSTAGAPAHCGPVALQFQRGALRLQVSDLVYRLQFRIPKTQMRMVLMHGLRFTDPDKDVRYEVRWTAPSQR
jgi:hypothetical protein